MPSISQLKRKDVKKEVKRIQKLPEYERKRQMEALCKKVIDEIETTSTRLKIYNRFWDKKKEARKLLSCVKVFPEDYRKFIYITWDKAFAHKVNKAFAHKVNNTNTNNVEQIIKTNAAHVSGLPLPEQAEVNIWWQGYILIFQSQATQFSLPIERIIGMGTTLDSRGRLPSYFLTIEYKKEGEIKYVVVRTHFKLEFNNLIEYFNQIKVSREKIWQEL